MPYQFATEDKDYSDYASGRVIYSQPGAPAFPVRLASEIFQRARQYFPAAARLALYDPTCGGAYHLAALGFLHGEAIRTILASDVDERVLALARRNLGLLSEAGLAHREQEIQAMLAGYGKASHAEALDSLQRLRVRLEMFPAIHTRVFAADPLDRVALMDALAGEPVELVISDVPYGQLTAWTLPDKTSAEDRSPVWRMLEALLPVLSPNSIVAIAADKSQKIAHEQYRRVERFQVGKRQVSLLTPQ